jgi:hypothetical protein
LGKLLRDKNVPYNVKRAAIAYKNRCPSDFPPQSQMNALNNYKQKEAALQKGLVATGQFVKIKTNDGKVISGRISYDRDAENRVGKYKKQEKEMVGWSSKDWDSYINAYKPDYYANKRK